MQNTHDVRNNVDTIALKLYQPTIIEKFHKSIWSKCTKTYWKFTLRTNQYQPSNLYFYSTVYNTALPEKMAWKRADRNKTT